jgi:DNA-binding NtrC family response regulator
VITLSLPPLQDKLEDIPVLINHFLDNFCKNRQKKILLPEVMTVMTQYNWPGNVRELKNTIERLVVMTEGNSISIEGLPENIRGASSTTAEGTEVILSEVEKKHILKVLHEKQENKTLAAEALGISLKTLYNKLKAYNIDS